MKSSNWRRVVPLSAMVLMIASEARGETLRLACEYRSGAFTGERLSGFVDFSTGIGVWAERGRDFGQEKLEITPQYITFWPRSGLSGRRIDRTTGIVSFNHLAANGNMTGWDHAVFGVPGLVCRPPKGF